jgi:quinoprotein glucose dehydrogenase
MRVARSLNRCASIALLLAGASTALAKMPDGDWQTINRDLASTRFSPLNQINKSNVATLKQAWSYTSRSFGTAVPLVIDGTMYLPAGSRLIALDADTGKEVWTYSFPANAAPTANANSSARPPATPTFSTRGLGYWPGDAKTPARLLVMSGSKLMAFDLKTGQPVASFGDKGGVDVGVGYGGTPTISGDVAMIGAATLENPTGVPGNPRAFDVRTGKKLWEFQTVPKKGQLGADTWLADNTGRSGTNMWGFSAPVDEATGTVYIPLGSPSPNYWGGSRPGSNLFGNTVLALDMKTGKYKWHFQTVHHDLWDSDQPTAGPLIDVTVKGKKQKGIMAVNKTSLFFELDSKTGKPLQPVEERPVPKGDVPGEYYSPTQPFPVNTPALSRNSMTKADIVTADDTTPEHAAACQAMWDKAGGYRNDGPYTPLYFHKAGDPPRSTIQLPGGTGGVNWGGPAADPTTGWVFVNAQATSLVGWTEKVEGDKSYSFDATVPGDYDRASVNGKGPFFSFSAPISGKFDAQGRGVGPGLNCYKGPWGQLIAIDANTGAIKWKVPLGLVEGLPAGKQLQGNSGSAGPTVTGGGLVFVGATNDKRFRAFDAATGKQLWETTLSNNANANPMSYRGRSGKQYVAINAGGAIVAYALP